MQKCQLIIADCFFKRKVILLIFSPRDLKIVCLVPTSYISAVRFFHLSADVLIWQKQTIQPFTLVQF